VPILLVIVTGLAVALYLLTWRIATRRETAPATGAAPAPALDRGAALLGAALLAHAAALYVNIDAGAGFRFGFAPALSATLWVGMAMLWFEGLSVRIDALRAVMVPIAVVAVVLPLFFPGSDFGAERGQPLFLPHLLVGTLAYGVLMLAALHATLMTAAERSLHGSLPGGLALFSRWLEDLPPLLVLERILFRFIATGFVLLTLTAASGVLFSEQVFGRPLRFDHKTVFTLIAWLLFGALLLGRHFRGWRGRTALRLTIAGFMVLLLAYVGSRFVLEVLLQRT